MRTYELGKSDEQMRDITLISSILFLWVGVIHTSLKLSLVNHLLESYEKLGTRKTILLLTIQSLPSTIRGMVLRLKDLKVKQQTVPGPLPQMHTHLTSDGSFLFS